MQQRFLLQILLLAQHVSGIVVPKNVEQAVRSAIKISVASSWHFISTDLSTSIFRNVGRFPVAK